MLPQLRKNTISLAYTKAQKVLIMNSKGGVGKSMIWRVWAGNKTLGPENLYSPSKTDLDPTLKSPEWAD